MQSLIDRFRQAVFDRNAISFNFFMAKPISQLEDCRRLPHVIGFADLQFLLQDDMECLKRYYIASETEPRLDKLTCIPKLMQNSTVKVINLPNPTLSLCGFGGHCEKDTDVVRNS